MQVLRVVNPYCTYSMGQRKGKSGVAVLLKEFLRVLDSHDIEHEEECVIRRKLRSEVKTTATQFFLKEGVESAHINRKSGDCKHYSCIIIPQSDVPQAFFDLITEKEEGTCI